MRESFREKFDRNAAAEFAVGGLVNVSHSTGAKVSRDFVMCEPGSDHNVDRFASGFYQRYRRLSEFTALLLCSCLTCTSSGRRLCTLRFLCADFRGGDDDHSVFNAGFDALHVDRLRKIDGSENSRRLEVAEVNDAAFDCRLGLQLGLQHDLV